MTRLSWEFISTHYLLSYWFCWVLGRHCILDCLKSQSVGSCKKSSTSRSSSNFLALCLTFIRNYVNLFPMCLGVQRDWPAPHLYGWGQFPFMPLPECSRKHSRGRASPAGCAACCQYPFHSPSPTWCGQARFQTAAILCKLLLSWRWIAQLYISKFLVNC